MATNKPIISIVLDKETLDKLVDYQFENRFKSRSQAAVDLIKKGLEQSRS